MPDQAQARAKLGGTRMFQSATKALFEDLLLQSTEEHKDARHILLRWHCTDAGIIGSDAVPIEWLSGEHGVPVCGLVFLLPEPANEAVSRSKLCELAGVVRDRFWALVEQMEARGVEGRLEDVASPEDKAGFTEIASAFAREYVRFENPCQGTQRALALVVSDAFDLSETGVDEHREIYLKVKAFYYGMHGRSLSLEALEGMRALRRRMQLELMCQEGVPDMQP